MAMSMLEFLRRQAFLEELIERMKHEKRGKEIFGQIMHNDDWTDAEKNKVLAAMEEMGGYECLGE